jgi:alanyl-tRNA synthetase
MVEAGYNASNMVREAAKLINGGGGGQPFLATAGGKKPEGLDQAVAKVVELI